MSEAAEAAPPRSKDEDEGSSATGSVARRPRRREAWTGEVLDMGTFLEPESCKA